MKTFLTVLLSTAALTSLGVVGCAAPDERETSAATEGDALRSSGTRQILTYGIAHSPLVEGGIPDDGNLSPSNTGMFARAAASKPITTYFARVEAGQKLFIATGTDGIYKYGDPPPGWTGECYEGCLPRIQLARFDRTFLGYKLGGREREIELHAEASRTATIDIPADATGTIEYWFRFEDAYHRSLWDSRRGENYRVEIIPSGAATIHFGASGAPTVSGTLKRGGAARVEYTLSRFSSFVLGGTTRADKIPRLEVAMSFDRLRNYEWSSLIGEASSSSVVDIPKLVANGWTYYPDQVLVSPVFKIPETAQSAFVWAFGEAINLDVRPVERPFLIDGKRGMTRPNGQLTPADVFELPL